MEVLFQQLFNFFILMRFIFFLTDCELLLSINLSKYFTSSIKRFVIDDIDI